MHTTVIAEAGSTWQFGERPLEHAYDAIQIAARAGADVVKFQWVSDPRRMEERRHVPVGSYDILAWPEDWLSSLASAAQATGIEFLCTIFLSEDVDVLNPFVKRWKVASLERDDVQLLRAMRQTTKPLIVSCGADDLQTRLIDDQILHCTLAYPAPLEQLNLLAIHGMSGYSDHSADTLTGALAVACGAQIVEVHFKLNTTPLDNHDFPHSLWPYQLSEYIRNIRKAEIMLGTGIKRIEKCEEWALKHKVKV